MTPAIIHGFLWLVRGVLRAGRRPVHAGQGYLDPAYRPARLPFVSVVAPLSVALDPQRDTLRAREATIQGPGHVVSAVRDVAQVVDAGALRLRFDGDAAITIAVPAGTFDTPANASGLAAALQSALRAGADAATPGYTDLVGQPITAPTRLAELVQATCRWDEHRRVLAISSGRRGVIEDLSRDRAFDQRSTVEILAVPDSRAAMLGLEGRAAVEGRLRKHSLAVPRAMTVDVRLELWAESQTALAALSDHLGRVAAVRSSFVIYPALLADDAVAGATSVRLLPQGEPVTTASMALIEAASGLVDRVTGRRPTAAGVAPIAGGHVHLEDAQRVELILAPTPLVPDARDGEDPAPEGLAITLGFRVQPGAVAGQSCRLASITSGARSLLQLDLAFGAAQSATLTARAVFLDGGAPREASTTWEVPGPAAGEPNRWERGVIVHAAVVDDEGMVELYLDGALRRMAAAPAPVRVAGRLAASHDLLLAVGAATGTPNPRWLEVSHCHVFSEPRGPLDPGVRAMTTPAGRLRPGQRLRFAQTENGFTPLPGAPRAETTVVSAVDDTVHIAPPVEGVWRIGQTLLFVDELFFQPMELRRRDDVVNQVHRLSGDYRVAALLDSESPGLGAPYAERLEVETRARTTRGPAARAPGVRIEEKGP